MDKEYKDGGMDCMEVEDNGKGMKKDHGFYGHMNPPKLMLKKMKKMPMKGMK